MTTKTHLYEPVHNLSIGQIYEVDGNQIRIELDANLEELTRIYRGDVYSIGQFGSIIQIPIGRRTVFAMVTKLTMKNEVVEPNQKLPPKDDSRIIIADLFGEGEWEKNGDDWKLKFQRGVSEYPLPLQTAYLTEKSTLEHIYKTRNDGSIELGEYVGSGGVSCHADMSKLIGKHTAIMGSTGSGKSATTAAILHAILEHKPKTNDWSPQIIILDPHGEYKKAFEAAAVFSTEAKNLSLPYWAMNGIEFLTLIFTNKLEAATVQVPKVQNAVTKLKNAKYSNSQKPDSAEVNIDAPIAFSWEDLETELAKEKSILAKIKALREDKRLDFITREYDKKITIEKLIESYFVNSQAPVIIDLSGVPNEIAGLCCSTLASLLFNFKTWQTPEERAKNPILLVCEEAHRYVPNSGDAQYGDAQKAIQRIAKEGRKYGIGLFLVSQRPSEIDQTVLSQCNSWIVLRLTNEDDRSKVASILPDSLSGLTKTLSGLRDREAVFAGLASDIPARIRIRDLKNKQVPASNDIDFVKGWSDGILSDEDLNEIIRSWQHQSMTARKSPRKTPKKTTPKTKT